MGGRLMRKVLPGIEHWWHELANCLHASCAIVLTQQGDDALRTLGSAWSFQYRPGDVRREEYYHPCLPSVSLLESLAPHQPVRSRWHQPVDGQDGWQQVRAQVLAGRPAIVAVDNFHLPFRPAYHDVHTNHLVVVFGFDDEAQTAEVIDSVPPRFRGSLALADLLLSRDSDNPLLHERDMFFTANPIGNRWFDIEWSGPLPVRDLAGFRRSLAVNIDEFDRPPAGEWTFGEAALRQIFGAFAEVASTDEMFVVAGAALAKTALHAEYLREAGQRWEIPALAEAARAVSQVAHHLTALRILAVRSRGRDDAIDAVNRRGRRLIAAVGLAKDALALCLRDLDRGRVVRV